MLCRKILFSIIFLACYLQAYSEVFKVTTNADIGPGSLREALTKAAANGNAEKDYIQFEIPGTDEVSRTITIKTQLPAVTSNLVIDGSTQTGTKFGLSDARVRITLDKTTYIVHGYYDGALHFRAQENIEIYGLMIDGFGGFLRSDNMNNAFYILAAIYNSESINITIGAPGKGNYITNNLSQIYCGVEEGGQRLPKNIKIQSNVMIHGGQYSETNNISGIDILFGGDTPEEGNSFTGTLNIGYENIVIANNLFSIDRNGKYLEGVYSTLVTGGKNVTIRNNKNYGVDHEIRGGSNVQMYANIEYNASRSVIPINVLGGSDIIIGSDDENLRNIIYNGSTNGIVSNTKNLQILKNSIYCTNEIFMNYEYRENIPVVLVNNDTEYSGTAVPGSYIYIYEDNTGCEVCNPVVFLAKILTDANGKWKYTGDFKGRKILSNALIGTSSSEFAVPWFQSYQTIEETYPSCGKKNGQLRINDVRHTLKIVWYDDQNNKVGEGNPLKNVGAGKYYAICYNGNCQRRTETVTLIDATPKVIDNQMIKTDPSCNKGGSITQLQIQVFANHRLALKWTDAANKAWGTERDINNLPAGSYTFTVTDVETNCSTTYGPVVLTQTTGPAIDEANAKIKQTDCGQSNGSVSGIKASGNGTITYKWVNQDQKTVATTANLINQPAGTYTLTITDQSQCDALTSKTYEITELNGVTLNAANVLIKGAACDKSNGSISGITTSGATRYEWRNETNIIIGTGLDLDNAPTGNYTLTAYNNTCSASTGKITIPLLAETMYPEYAIRISPSCANGNTGSIDIATDNLPIALRWSNAQGVNIGSTEKITDLQAGAYTLYLTDQYGCEKFYARYNVDVIPLLKINAGSERITDDKCSQGRGSITGISFTGGVAPYTYRWLNNMNSTISNSVELYNAVQGIYTLEVSDASGCNTITNQYTIGNNDNLLAPPTVANTELCSPGMATLSVSNKNAGITYALYNSTTSFNPLAESSTGVFKINVTANSNFYISAKQGSCESVRTTVSVTVGISNLNIANTFTPNGDGINDEWKITGVENYPASNVKIFNRNGQKVFESTGYKTPFNGTLNGSYLPAGTYYYIISLSANCKIISGHLALIR